MASHCDSALGSEQYEEELDLDGERSRLMARNRAKLLALGIALDVSELRDLSEQHRQARAKHRTPSSRVPREPLEPTRRSTRLAASAAGGGAAAAAGEGLVQLGEGGGAEAQAAGSQAHEAGPRRRRDPLEGLSPEEIETRAAELRAQQKARLRDLELEGLVDLTEDAATFVVIGSTGKHYTVRLTGSARKCNCMDCRIRKRDCKHIRLIMEQLGIEGRPAQWHQAVEEHFSRLAGGGAGAGGATAAEGEEAGAAVAHGGAEAEEAVPEAQPPAKRGRSRKRVAGDAEGGAGAGQGGEGPAAKAPRRGGTRPASEAEAGAEAEAQGAAGGAGRRRSSRRSVAA